MPSITVIQTEIINGVSSVPPVKFMDSTLKYATIALFDVLLARPAISNSILYILQFTKHY